MGDDRDREGWMARIASQLARLLVEATARQPFKGPVRVDEEADRVRWIFDQYLRCGRTLEDICAELNEREVPFRDSDVAWQPSRLRRILGNWLHAGLNEGNDGELDRGAHFDQRIIDPDVYYAVQELRAKRSTRGPRALSQRDAPLLGVARCGMCGQRVQLQRDQRNQPLYVCPRPQEGESRTCDGFSKRADAVDTVVADFIRQIASAPRLRAMVREEATAQLGEGRERLQKRRDSLEREMQALDDRLEEWAVKLTDGVVGEEAFVRISQRWQADLATAEEELADVQRRLEHGDVEERRVRQVMDALDNFTDTWERLEAPAIRQLLLSMVEELTIEPGRDASVTVRLKCYYMPEMTARIPHLREAIGGDEPRLAKLTPTDLGFLALWAEGKSYRGIEQARGLKKNVADSQAHRVRKRTGMDDLDEIAERLDGLAASTIRRHMSNLRQRLEVETNEEAITALVGVGLRLAIPCTSVDVGAQKPRLIVGEWEGEPLRAALCRGLKPPAPSAFGSCPRGRKLGSVP